MTRLSYLALAATVLAAGCMSNGSMDAESDATMTGQSDAAMTDGAQEGGGVESQPEADEVAEPTTGY